MEKVGKLAILEGYHGEEELEELGDRDKVRSQHGAEGAKSDSKQEGMSQGKGGSDEEEDSDDIMEALVVGEGGMGVEQSTKKI